jgi:hypothetical protein
MNRGWFRGRTNLNGLSTDCIINDDCAFGAINTSLILTKQASN